MAFRCAHCSTNAVYLGIRYKKKPELTDIEVTAGPGARLQKYMEFQQQQLEGGLWLRNFMDSLFRLF